MSNWPYPHIVAHRGGGKLAPENTLADVLALKAKNGFSTVAITADGPVLIEGNAYPSVQIMQTAGLEGMKRRWFGALKG